ncbi:hypothetical protein GW7_08677 [Heterocephalus glaber]|uniref:Uncharacterized protein n=1 Tax=Heterocephalus glaber TaxID=10181 RepID=G5BC95_HETGA|nr:hypothetical protein GW7_08677 [Heterocephalus glaber]
MQKDGARLMDPGDIYSGYTLQGTGDFMMIRIVLYEGIKALCCSLVFLFFCVFFEPLFNLLARIKFGF